MAEKDAKKKDEEGDEAPAAAAPAAPAGSGKMKILMIVGFVVVLCAVAGTSILVLTKKTAKATEQLAADSAEHGGEPGLVAEGAGDEEEELADDEERLGTIVPLDTFVVNLNGGKYLRAQIQLEFEGVQVPGRFTTRLVPIRDGMITILTKKSPSDVESAKGKEELKRELKDFVNETLKKEDIKRVYFTQFVVQ